MKTKEEIVKSYRLHRSLTLLKKEMLEYETKQEASKIIITFDGKTDAISGLEILDATERDTIIHFTTAIQQGEPTI